MYSKRLLLTTILALQIATLLPGQSKPSNHFDAISIRPSKPSDTSVGYSPNPNNFQAQGVTLEFLIELAYGVNASDIVGVPPKFSNEKFDIQAKAQPTTGTKDLRYSSDAGASLFEERLQSLLAERFRLKLHHAQLARHVLVLEATSHTHLLPPKIDNPLQTTGPGHIKFDRIDMDGLATVLTANLSMNVVNRTNIPGDYAVELTWELPTAAESQDVPTGPVNDALLSQMGLKLAHGKAEVPVLIIESATMPTPN